MPFTSAMMKGDEADEGVAHLGGQRRLAFREARVRLRVLGDKEAVERTRIALGRLQQFLPDLEAHRLTLERGRGPGLLQG
jgi:hypothetical protein